MRKPLIFLIAVIFAFATMPFVFGVFTKYKLEKIVSELKPPQGVFIELADYELGYLNSYARINIKMYDPKEAMQPAELPTKSFEFNTHLDIKHGPFFKSDDGFNVGFAFIHNYTRLRDIIITDEVALKGIEEFVGTNELISFHAIVGLTGSLTGRMHSTNLNYQSDDFSINWPGAEGYLYLSGDSNTLDANLDIAPMLLNAKDDVVVDFSRMTFASNAKRESNMPWMGEETFSIPAFYLRDNEGNEIRFSNFIVTAASTINKNLANVTVEARADNIKFFEQEILDTKFSLILDHLDAPSLMKFSEVTKGDEAKLTDKQKQQLTFALIDMLSPGALFSVEHDMKLPEGDIKAKVFVQFPDLSAQKDVEPPEAIAQKLIMRLNAALNFQAPTVWLENMLHSIAVNKLPPNLPAQKDPTTGQMVSPQQALRTDIKNQLSAMGQAGVLVTDDKHYSLQLDYENGNIILNGNTLTQEDINNLMQLFSNEPQ